MLSERGHPVHTRRNWGKQNYGNGMNSRVVSRGFIAIPQSSMWAVPNPGIWGHQGCWRPTVTHTLCSGWGRPWKASSDVKSRVQPTEKDWKTRQGVWAQLSRSRCRARQRPQEETRKQPKSQGRAERLARGDAASISDGAGASESGSDQDGLRVQPRGAQSKARSRTTKPSLPPRGGDEALIVHSTPAGCD